jgi:glutathione S-transferase
MDLYYSPFACSLAARIVCLEAGIPVSLRRSDLSTKRVDGEAEGALLRVNRIGKVPVLVCDDGTVLTENVAVLLYLGDQAPPERALVPADRTPARYEVVRWLSFVATELHKRVLATVFSLDNAPEPVRRFARDGAREPLAVLDEHLQARKVLVGDTFTVADAYLVWALFLLPRPRCEVSLEPYRAVGAYLAHHCERASVMAALSAEYREYRVPGWWTASQLKD